MFAIITFREGTIFLQRIVNEKKERWLVAPDQREGLQRLKQAFHHRRDRGSPVPIISNIPQSISTRLKLPPIVIIWQLQRHPVARLGTFVPVPPNPSLFHPSSWLSHLEREWLPSPTRERPRPSALPSSSLHLGATSINGRFRVVSDGCVGGLGWRSSHPRHRWKRTDTSKRAGVALDNRRCGARYIGGTYAWPGFVCRSVRPSFANAQPGCPVSADDRSHHRVLTAGPAIGGGNRPCGIISPKCDGLGRWRERGIRVSCADSLPIIAYDIASVSFRYFSRFFSPFYVQPSFTFL